MKKQLLIIQVLLILIFLSCGAYICKYFYDARGAGEGYEELRQLVKETPREDVTDGYIPDRAENGMLTAYYELYKRNNDLAGWIKIPGTCVDYPVVKHGDNDYYLHRNFEKKYQYCGIPFLDFQCDGSSLNSIIYAHNMKDGSMFAALTEYKDKAFFESHKEILFDTVYDKGKYTVIAAFSTRVGAEGEFKYYEYADIETEERFNEYLNNVKRLSFYDTGVNAVYGDKLITLSTCSYRTSNERVAVVAKKK